MGRYTTKQVMDFLQVSRTTLWRRVRDGAFPRPVPGEKGRWRKSEVDSFLNGESLGGPASDDARLLNRFMGANG